MLCGKSVRRQYANINFDEQLIHCFQYLRMNAANHKFIRLIIGELFRLSTYIAGLLVLRHDAKYIVTF